jgi:hypothetical protein
MDHRLNLQALKFALSQMLLLPHFRLERKTNERINRIDTLWL